MSLTMPFLITLPNCPNVGGEIQLTDAVDALIGSRGVDVVTMTGSSFDAGDMTSYMRAFMYFAQRQLSDK